MPRQFQIELIRHDEIEGPEGFFSSGDPEFDRETCHQIRYDLEHGNEWAWFSAEVKATDEHTGLSESAFLGACSYPSEWHFRHDPYFDDLVHEASGRLSARLDKLYRLASADQLCGHCGELVIQAGQRERNGEP